MVLNEEVYGVKFKLDIEFNEVVNLQSIKGSIEAGIPCILTALPGGGFYFLWQHGCGCQLYPGATLISALKHDFAPSVYSLYLKL
jgi:hypothetical protein